MAGVFLAKTDETEAESSDNFSKFSSKNCPESAPVSRLGVELVEQKFFPLNFNAQAFKCRVDRCCTIYTSDFGTI